MLTLKTSLITQFNPFVICLKARATEGRVSPKITWPNRDQNSKLPTSCPLLPGPSLFCT